MKRFNRNGRVVVSLLALLTLCGCGGSGNSETESAKPSDNSVSVAPEKVKGISLDKEAASVDAGSTLQLTATLTPEGATGEITWSSSDTAVATVDANGLVTGVNAGTCNIVATVGDLTATCSLTVTGFHINSNIFEHIGKIENNAYNSQNGYKDLVVETDNTEYTTIKFNRKDTNEWASLACWYDQAFTANEFYAEFELVSGELPFIQLEFSGEVGFKFYERIELKQGEKSSLDLNITDLNYKTGEAGEGSWGSIFIEPNAPMSEDAKKGADEEVELRIYKFALKEGTKKAPEKIKNVEFDETTKKVKFDKNYASNGGYDIEVYKVEGESETKLDLDVRPTRFIATENIPNMKLSFTPKTEENFANTPGSYKARVRGKNSVGEGEWSEFCAFTIEEPPLVSSYVSEGFLDDGNIGINQWNGNTTFKAEKVAEGFKLTFTGSDAGEWSSFELKFDKTGGYTKLDIEFNIVKGSMTRLDYEFTDWGDTDEEKNDGKQQGSWTDLVTGANVVHADITKDLNLGTGSLLLQPDHEKAATGEVEFIVTSIKLSK